MATTFQLISTVTVGAGSAANIEFSSIPATFTDLKLLLSGRNSGTSTGNEYQISLNNSTTGFTTRALYGGGTSAASFTDTNKAGIANNSSQTANTFDNIEILFPNYLAAINKIYSVDGVTESNAASTGTYQILSAGLWSNTAAITSIKITPPTGSFVQYSSASLYGIKSS